MAAPTIKFKRGAQVNLPALSAGEPAFVNDEYNLYLGLDGTTGNNKFLGSLVTGLRKQQLLVMHLSYTHALTAVVVVA